jgi:hypothetical protein
MVEDATLTEAKEDLEKVWGVIVSTGKLAGRSSDL